MQNSQLTIVGVDISKAYFDICITDADGKNTKGKLSNDKKGFLELLKIMSSESWVVMEASGPYYYQLACFFMRRALKYL